MDAMAILAQNPARRRALAMAGYDFTPDNPRAPADEPLPDEQKEGMMEALQRQAGGALEVAGKVIDTPAAIARGVLTGDPGSGFSWDSDRRVSGQELLQHYGLLKPDDNPYFRTFAGLAAEVAVDPLSLISGPLNSLTAAGRAAKAAGILDKASDAALAARGIEGARDSLATGKAAYKFLGDLLPAGKAITKENAAVRPLVGPRVARNTTTLEETIKSISDPQQSAKALADVENYLSTKGLTYDAVKGEKLGGAAGLNFFGLADPLILQTDSPAALKAMDYLDAAGQMAMWSPAARGASALFDQRVNGRMSSYDQLMNLRHWDDLQGSLGTARQTASRYASMVAGTELTDDARQLLGADSLNSAQGGDFLTRMLENVPTQGDMRIAQAIGPERVKDIVSSFDEMRNTIRTEADKLGMVSRRLKDRFDAEWVPRKAQEADFGDYGKGLSKNAFYARSLENEARRKHLQMPGGTVDLRQINLLPKVQQFIREGEKSGLSVADVGAEIKKFIDLKHGGDTPEARAFLQSLGLQYDPRVNPIKRMVPLLDNTGKAVMTPALDDAGNAILVQKVNEKGRKVFDAARNPVMEPKMVPVIDQNSAITSQQAELIARFYKRKDLSIDDATPMFSENPLTSISRAYSGQARARVNAAEVYRSLGEAAQFAGAGKRGDMLPGTNLTPLDRALNKAALATGLKISVKTQKAARPVQNLLREQIARVNNMNLADVKLSEWAVDEKVINRLTAVNDFYSRPRAQDAVMNMFGQLGQIYKSMLLAFPSRFTRDLYSNTYQIWTLARNPGDVLYGMRTAKALLAGESDNAAALLAELPGYKGTSQELVSKLNDDVARTGILQTLSSSDLLTANRTAELNSLVPGMAPQRGLDFVKELVPDGSRNPVEMVKDYFTIRGTKIPLVQKTAAGETRNALLNASQKLNDWTDGVARLGGMLSLMKQGVSAEEAARRVTDALVDYSSLTSVERNFFKVIFPWWSYMSRSGKYAVQELLTNPGGPYGQTLRAFNRFQESDEDTYVPEALRQQFAVRVPQFLEPYLRIPHDSNTTTFLRDIDIPGHDVISLFSPGPGIYPTVKSTAANLLQQTNPLIQSAAEIATGQDLFSRRPLEHADSSLDRIYKQLSGSKTNMNPILRQGIELIPGPRVSGIAGGLLDQRIPMDQRIAKTLVNTLTGIKLQTVDPAYQLSDARRILAEELSPFMREYTEDYIPKDVLPQVPPEMLPKYQLFKSLGKDLREIRKAKK
jgi:hypothetical protein